MSLTSFLSAALSKAAFAGATFGALDGDTGAGLAAAGAAAAGAFAFAFGPFWLFYNNKKIKVFI